MAKPIVIESLKDQPAHLREAIRRAEEARQYGKKRAKDMDILDLALDLDQQTKQETTQPTRPQRQPINPLDGPPIFVTPGELTQPKILAEGHAATEQARAEARERQSRETLAQVKEAERIRKAQEGLLGKEEAERLLEQQRREEERTRTLLGIADRVVRSAKDRGSNVGARIASLPTPGSFWTPLIILLVLFFILIRYNGHTRFEWIWLTLTNNAYISYASAPGTSGPAFPVPATTNTTGQAGGGETVYGLFSASANGTYGEMY